MTETQLEDKAQKARAIWVNEHRAFELRTTGIATGWGSKHMIRWDGGKHPNGREFISVWPKIVDFCVEHNLDLVTLIRAMFYRVVDRPPVPDQAHGDYALEKYKNFTSKSTELEMKNELIHKFESQKSLVAAEVASRKAYHMMDEASAWRAVISNKLLPFTPLFRYCVAKNQQWDTIAALYHDEALCQYKRQAELYDDIWQEWIPLDFKSVPIDAQRAANTKETKVNV